MRLRRREINVFSMSALDLFASGMGAFILLAVMALPFFPNTGDSKQRIQEVKRELASVQQERDIERKQLDDAKSRVRSLEEALAKARMPDLDIVICLDVTGSMTRQIEGLKREISVLAEILDGLAPSTGIGLVAFGDRRWQQPIHVQEIVSTARIRDIQAFAQRLRPSMDPNARYNTDGPEAVATAVERAVSLNWRAESKRRYVIAVTDNAAYPSRELAALQAAQSFAATDGQFVSTVRANFSQDQFTREAADRFLRRLAQAGRGQFIDAAGGESMIGSLLLAVIGT